MIRDITILVFRFITYVLIQVLVLNNVQFSGYINPYPYVFFILTLPLWIPRNIALIIAFLMGIIIDGFMNTGGMHTAATLFVAYFSRPLLFSIKAKSDLKSDEVSLSNIGTEAYTVYILAGLFIHHFVLFLIENFSFTGWWFTIKVTFGSWLFSVVIAMIYEMFRIKSKQEVY